jgi:folate-binding protein YgfZ
MTVAHLASRALISLRGPDWRSFLQGLITQDVVRLIAGDACYGALLTPQGRLLSDLFVIDRGDDGALLDVAAGGRDALIAKLGLYRLRANVKIAAEDGVVLAAWAEGAPGEGWIEDPRLTELGWRRAAPFPPPAGAVSETVYDAHRLALGVGDPDKDAVESDYPIELNLDLLNGIDFKKGCFVGQETTSRMHRRGQVKTRLTPIVFDGPTPPFGAELLAGDRRAGAVRGGATGRAFALVRMDRAQGVMTVDGRPVKADPPPWLARLFDNAAQDALQSVDVLSQQQGE